MKAKNRVEMFNQEVSELKRNEQLVCERINDFNSNRCINCGAKAGHKCEINTN
jgi:hypothetical protein